MTHPNGEPDDFTELHDADIPRVDLVGKGANGIPHFLLMKADQQGLMDPDTIRDLIAKADPQPEPETVSVTGSPAAIMRMIHEAAVRKKDFTAAERHHDADTGAAMPDGSYPIENVAQLDDAIRAVGRGGTDHDAIRRHIEARAHRLGATDKIPDNWAADGSLKKEAPMTDAAEFIEVEKADTPDVEVEDLTVDAPAGSTAESVPGSPDWENLDGDTAMNALSVLGRVKAVVEWLSDREATEAVTADPDDADSAFDLADIACQLDYIIGRLGAFAAGEKLEAELAGELAAVGKTVAALTADTTPVATLEGLSQVTKAGRVLSTANEAAIRGAVESLQKVLASLPAAPPAIEAPVTKETDMAEQTSVEVVDDDVAEMIKAGEAAQRASDALADAIRNIEKAADAEPRTNQEPAGVTDERNVVTTVAKAKGDPMVICYNANGKAIGLIDPEKLQPIADDASAASSDDEPKPAAEPKPEQPAAEPPAAAPAPTAAPADADAATIPGTDTVQSPTASDDDTVEKAQAVDLGAFTEALTSFTEQLNGVAKAAELGEIVKSLQERVEQIAKMPDDRKSPRLNGASGTSGIASRNGQIDDPHAELRKQLDEATDPTVIKELQQQLAYRQIRDRFIS